MIRAVCLVARRISRWGVDDDRGEGDAGVLGVHHHFPSARGSAGPARIRLPQERVLALWLVALAVCGLLIEPGDPDNGVEGLWRRTASEPEESGSRAGYG